MGRYAIGTALHFTTTSCYNITSWDAAASSTAALGRRSISVADAALIRHSASSAFPFVGALASILVDGVPISVIAESLF
jgi:hypothetical protein